MGYVGDKDDRASSQSSGPDLSSAKDFAGVDLAIREVQVADLADVLAIERASFASPWSREFFVEELEASCANSVLSDLRGVVVGYCLYWVLASDIDIHNIAVHPDYRRRGVGRRMLSYIIGQAKSLGSESITLEVRKSNGAAQGLYRSLGFEICGVRKRYYSNDGEDAWVMLLRVKSE